MDYTNLQALAEVSVTLLGFSGLTIVMGHSRFDQHGLAYRTQGMLYNSSLGFIGSLLPLLGIPISLGVIVMAVLMSTLALWLSLFVLSEQMLFIYKLAIGCNLLVAVVFFIRLVISFFDTEEVSSDA